MTLDDFITDWKSDAETVLVHTSGSTGKPKPLFVEKKRMEASALMTCDFLGLRPGDSALLCMPIDYIAGKMVVVRSFVRQLRLIVVKPSGHPLRELTEIPTFVAMTPMQVFNTLSAPEERDALKQIKHLIIGGGAISEDMANELRTFPNAVWSTYGMTETLSHIALRRLSGPTATDWYTPFDSVTISADDQNRLIINAPKVCPTTLTTNDICELKLSNNKTLFRIKGRIDNVICSGGIKIQAEEVENLLAPHINVPFMITKKSDPKFGEAVVLVMAGGQEEEAKNVCLNVLPKYWVPKEILTVKNLQYTETGKIKRIYPSHETIQSSNS